MYPEKLEVLAMLYKAKKPIYYLDIIKRDDSIYSAALYLTMDGLANRVNTELSAPDEDRLYFELSRKGRIYVNHLMRLASMLSST